MTFNIGTFFKVKYNIIFYNTKLWRVDAYSSINIIYSFKFDKMSYLINEIVNFIN